MTTDTGSLPRNSLERAVKAVNEAEREKARLRRILVTAITLIAAGALLGIGANIAVTAASDGHLDWVDTWKGLAHAVGVSGVVLLTGYLVIVMLKRHLDVPAARDARAAASAEATQAQLRGIEKEVRLSGGALLRELTKIDQHIDRLANAGDEAFVDALSEQADGPKTNGHKAVRLLRPRTYDDGDRPRRS